MDSAQTSFLRDLLAGTPWFGDCRAFAHAVRTAPRSEGGLLLVGTPEAEPWHFAAHLDQEADISGLRMLAPTLVRHHVPDGAPPHLAVDLSRLTAARNGEAVLVVAPDDPGERLLERVDDARRRGAAILALADDARAEGNELLTLAHDALLVPDGGPLPGFDAAEHLLAFTAGEDAGLGRRSFRDRLTAVLDRIAGSPVRDR